MQILETSKTSSADIISTAISVLSRGGLVIYPTETTYGIGADCTNPAAITKLLEYKGKRDGKPLSVAVADQTMAERYAHLNPTALQLYKTFLPGPVTVVSAGRHTVAPFVESPTGTIGIRIPAFPLILELVKAYDRGITATGANASYQKRPYRIQDIFDNISDKQKDLIDLVIDAGTLPPREPSTVIDTTLDDIQVMRFGASSFLPRETFTSQSPENTQEIAANLLSRYRSFLTYEPLIFALTGPMGAGKTQFAKGIAAGLRLSETITSPTYSLAHEYQFISEGRPGKLLHIDTWRMDSLSTLEEFHLPTLLKDNAALIIEWADKFSPYISSLPARLIWVALEPATESTRHLTITHPEKPQSL